ncbi:MAG TPA: phospholipid carrier-dependent glycosyltransferase [bacterium]|nr:phospholipid carrier-dependent glycosyltransferase [bacterium]
MSMTYDEPVYIAAGYSYWETRDDRMNGEHPPILKMLIALPLLSLGLTVPTDDPSWREGGQGPFSRAFLSRQGVNVERIVFRSRLSIVFIGFLLALFVRKWAAELWGAEAGLAALLLFVFEPNTLAHARLATLDLGLTAFTFISMFYVWKWLRTGRVIYAILASVALGFSLLSKEAALAFLPIFLGQFIVDDVAASRNSLPRHVHPFKGFFQVLAGAAVVVSMVYAVVFHWHPLLHIGGEHRTVDKVLARIPGLRGAVQTQVVALGQRIWVPDLDKYIEGLLDQRRHLIQGHASFLMGHHALHGWWYYYPIAFLIKTPLPILLLVIIRLVLLAAIPMVDGEYMIVFPIIGMMILACFDTADLGLRQILPLYPFLFIWLSRVVALELFGARRLKMRPASAPIAVER